MAQNRTVDEHLARLAAYVARVSALSAPAWARLEARCAALSDSSFAALLARANLTAKSNSLPLAGVAKRNPKLWAFTQGYRAFQHGFAFIDEVMAEFAAAKPSTPPSPRRVDPSASRKRRRDTNPRVAALADASDQLDAVLASRAAKHPGLVIAVRGAGCAVFLHDSLPPAAFSDLYQFIDAEIPFTSLEPPSSRAST